LNLLQHHLHLLSGLASQSGMSVDDLDVKLLGTLDDSLTLLGRNVVGDLSSVLAVVHQQQLNVLLIVYKESEEAIWTQVLCLLV